MGTGKTIYANPLVGRYTSKPMQELFGDQRKFGTWRRLWIALAEAEQELGINITNEQLAQMRAHFDDIDFEVAAAYERKLRHDVMAHIHAFGDVAPLARPIIHLGATSQYVNDNTDMLLNREALRLLCNVLANVIDSLAVFAAKHRDLACLGFTHCQPAQLVTVGKRAALWCYDFILCLRELERRLDAIEFLGVKGTTGTQESFMKLFDGNQEKVRQLDILVAKKWGFERVSCITGQTHSRLIDAAIIQSVALIGAAAHKFANDMRLLASMKEMEEPFEKDQVGSSAMAYKRNPMRCERATGLARWLMDISVGCLHTAAEQWFERTLDDSSNRRLAIPEAFLAADAILQIVLNVAQGMVVYPKVIENHVAAELPFMATEEILMAAVKAGGDRQDLHERIRVHSQAAAEQVKMHGKPNDLIQRLQTESPFGQMNLRELLDPVNFVGRAPQQVDDFIAAEVEPIRKKYAAQLGQTGQVKV